jgi:hypothetical protein
VFEFSGYTLELLADGYPDVIDRLRELVGRGQVELCASTYANPILPLIPLDHARRQIGMFQQIYERLFGDLGVAPAGFYPQEFALDPSLAPLLAEFGYRWVPVMLNHYLESLAGRLNVIPDLPLRASVARGEVTADLTHPFQIRGAGEARLAGLLNNPAMIDMLFELANGAIDVDAAVAAVVALHQRHAAAGPAFLFVGPSDMEFVGLELRAFIADWRWPGPIRPEHLATLLDRLRQLPFVRFATARDYLAEFPPQGRPLYLKCGSDHPLLTPWALDPDNERLNLLCGEAAERIRLAESLLAMAGPPDVTTRSLARAPGKRTSKPWRSWRSGGSGIRESRRHARLVSEASALLDAAWRALLLAENSDGRGWMPIPERRLFCYDQALRALDLAQQALAALRA